MKIDENMWNTRFQTVLNTFGIDWKILTGCLEFF
jgi:uncharacterized glyoxalase superfamily protein PhnB